MPDPGRFVASTRIVAGFSFLSRLTGLAREMIFARYFGAGELLSAFRIAFMVPNLARRLFGEGALSAAVVPVLTETLRTHGETTSRRFIGRLLILLTMGLTGIVLVIEVGLGWWQTITNDPAIELAAITLPYMPLICATAVVGAVLHVRRRFAAPAAAPILMNLFIVAATAGAVHGAGLEGYPLIRVVCMAVVAAGMAQLLLVGAALARAGFFPHFTLQRHRTQIRAVGKMMGPMILGLAAVQINSLVDYLIAYLFVLEQGQRVGPAVLGYAQFLYQLPLGVFGIGLATAIYPVLAERASVGDDEGLADVVGRGIRLSLFIGLPAAVGLIATSQPLVATLLQGGRFDTGATARVAATLVFYTLGLPAYFLQHVIVRAFHARKDGRSPARIALAMVGLNLVLNITLVFALQERGLALATAFCATIQVAWLIVKMRSAVTNLRWSKLAGPLAKTAASTAFMGAVLTVLVMFALPAWMADQPPWMTLAILVFTGVLAYTIASRVLGAEELHWLKRKSTDRDG